jgi:hypothetical protein
MNNQIQYLKMRIPEIMEKHDNGLATISETLTDLLTAIIIANIRYNMRLEKALMDQTGKRPHEILDP